MKSNLNLTDFKKRLAQLTSKEKDFFLVTPYNFSGTPFCGSFDDKTFELTRNSFWIHVKAIEIRGNYQQADNKTTEVIYTIGISNFFRHFSWTTFGLGIIVFNTILFFFRDKIAMSGFVTINGFYIFAYLWLRTVNWITTKIVNQRFKNEFEIEIEDEWEKLSTSARK